MVETVVTVERTTTQQTTAPAGGGGLSSLRINIGYFKTVPGIIKIVQFLLGIICMALASPAYIPATSYFLFVVVIAFIATVLWIFAYLLGIREALNVAINWIFTKIYNAPFYWFLGDKNHAAEVKLLKKCKLASVATKYLLIYYIILGVSVSNLRNNNEHDRKRNMQKFHILERTIGGLVNWGGDLFISSILGFICMVLATNTFFMLVTLVGFVTTVIWFFIYFLNTRQLHPLAMNWRIVELINTGIIAILYFIGFVLQLAKWSSYPYNNAHSRNIAAGVFGMFNFLAYAAGTYFLFLEHKNRTIQ